MKIWYHNVLDSQRDVAEVTGTRVRVGSDPDCDIVLRSPFVDHEAVTLELDGDARSLRVLGRNGCELDEERLATGTVRRLEPNNRIRLFPFLLTLDAPTEVAVERSVEIDELDDRMSALIRSVHVDLLEVMELDGDDEQRRENDAYLLQMERSIDEICLANGLTVAEAPDLVDHVAAEAVRAMIVGELIQSNGLAAESALFDDARGWSRIISASPECESEAQQLASRLMSRLGLGHASDLSETMVTLETRFASCFETVLPELLPDFRLYLARREVKKQIKDIVFGYGPLEDLLRMPTVTEIMVVNKDRIYVEKQGRVEQSGRRFITDAVTLTIANRIMSRVGRSVDRARPLVDARLLDGSRVNAVIPPVAVSGPCLTIRKFPAERLTMDRLVHETKSLSKEASEFLRAAVLAKKNLLISGGTGTGKTTLLNCLSDCLGAKERIVTVEDTAELQLAHEHVVRLETKHKNAEGGGEYTIRDLVKNALRMRPDRIVVGECRGGEALDMLQAMNTGHDGSLTTLHANTPEDVVRRLEVLVQSSDVALGADSIHSQISSAIDLVVQLHRTPEGPRVVSHITEVLPQRRGQKGVETRDLFILRGEEPRLTPTGRLPTFIDDLITKGRMELELMYP